jgi:hypothetical protein
MTTHAAVLAIMQAYINDMGAFMHTCRRTFALVSWAVTRLAQRSTMLWAPNEGGGYPFNGEQQADKQQQQQQNSFKERRELCPHCTALCREHLFSQQHSSLLCHANFRRNCCSSISGCMIGY